MGTHEKPALDSKRGAGIYPVLNQANTRGEIFEKQEDDDAFERILGEDLQYPEADAKLLSRWPLSRLTNWIAHVNKPLTESEIKAVR